MTQYGKPATDGQAIFQGDLVNKVVGGVADLTGLGPLVPTLQSGYTGTPGTTLILGVSANYGAASTLTYHAVADEVDLLIIGQCKTGTTIATGTHVGKNANYSKTTAGSTLTKQSGMTVDGATIQTTATLDLRIMKVATISPNAEGDSAILECLINKHQFAQGAAGV